MYSSPRHPTKIQPNLLCNWNEAHSRKKQLKIQLYCSENWSYTTTPIGPAELSAQEAIAFLSLVRCGGWINSSTIGPIISSGISFTPNFPQLSYALINSLIRKNLLSPAPSTPDTAFTMEYGEIVKLDVEQIHWSLRIPDSPTFVSKLESLITKDTWPETWGDECINFWKELAFAECVEFCNHSLMIRNLPISGITATTALIENLLQDFSVSQCYQLLWNSAGDAVDYRARKGLTAQHASNYMIGSCQRRADRVRAEKWTLKGFQRNFELGRSQVSHVLHDVFMRHGEVGFLSCIPKAATKYK